jgi:hypothetical protein
VEYILDCSWEVRFAFGVGWQLIEANSYPNLSINFGMSPAGQYVSPASLGGGWGGGLGPARARTGPGPPHGHAVGRPSIYIYIYI